jgi:hypothetical protein
VHRAGVHVYVRPVHPRRGVRVCETTRCAAAEPCVFWRPDVSNTPSARANSSPTARQKAILIDLHQRILPRSSPYARNCNSHSPLFTRLSPRVRESIWLLFRPSIYYVGLHGILECLYLAADRVEIHRLRLDLLYGNCSPSFILSIPRAPILSSFYHNPTIYLDFA